MRTLNDIWQSVLTILGNTMTRVAINTWLDDAELKECDGDRVVIVTPHEMNKSMLLTKFSDQLRAAFYELFSSDVELLVMTGDEYDVYARRQIHAEIVDDEYSFSNFVVGSSNKFAHAAAIAVAQKPAVAYNPLFIYGPSGLGKTHLLGAISGEFLQTFPGKQVTYVTSEDFTNDLISSISRGRMQEFRDKYRKSDLLLVDDIQFIAGKDSTMEEFFHTFNALHEARKQIVLTSDRTPKEIPKLEARLISRFEMGLLADISPPDYEMRCAIVLAKAKHLRIQLEDNVVDYIADKITNNVRQLEGAVKKMMALNAFMGLPLDLDTARRAIEDVFRENPGLNPTPSYIIEHVANFYGVAPRDITGQKRDHDIMLARHVAIYLSRTMTTLSLQNIGESFGRDSSTVRSSLAKSEELLRTNAAVKEAVASLQKSIREG